MQELVLENGAHVRVRPVPPHVEALFNQGIRESIPLEPKPPTQAVTMADGHVEQDVVTSGPDWDAYMETLVLWEDTRNHLVVDAFVGYGVLKCDYAVVEWSWDGNLWRRDVPEAWQFPPACDRAGVVSCGNRRVDFIGIELLTTAADCAAVDAIATGQTANITDEEAARIRAGFPPRSGRARDAATPRQGFLRRLALKISRGDGGRKGVGSDA